MKFADSPLVTVIIPESLDDPRRESHFVKSWTQQQKPFDLPFEVLVAMKDGDDAYAEEVRQHLRPQDQLIQGGFSSEIGCYAAAASAKGKFILFTENHTIAEPDCMAKLIAFVQEGTYQAASLRSEFRNSIYLDRQEEALYKSYCTEKWLKAGEWDRVRLRGFVIEKKLYFDLGEFPEDYELFSEQYFASKLSQMGIPVGYVEDAAVAHVNTGTFSHLRHDIESFAFGECVFRDKEYEKSTLHFFGEPEIWRHRAIHIPGMRRVLARVCYRVMRDALAKSEHALAKAAFLKATSHAFLSLIPEAMWGERSEVGIQWHRFCSFLFQKSKLALKSFERMWQATRDSTHLHYFIQNPEPEGYELPGQFKFADADPPQLFGFHQRESYEGRSFRWTEPLAAVRFRIQSGTYQVTIDTNKIRGADCLFPFRIAFNGHLITRVEKEDGILSFFLGKGWFTQGEQLLVFVSQPIKGSRKETRKLGFPVFDLDCKPVRMPSEFKEDEAVPA